VLAPRAENSITAPRSYLSRGEDPCATPAVRPVSVRSHSCPVATGSRWPRAGPVHASRGRDHAHHDGYVLMRRIVVGATETDAARHRRRPRPAWQQKQFCPIETRNTTGPSRRLRGEWPKPARLLSNDRDLGSPPRRRGQKSSVCAMPNKAGHKFVWRSDEPESARARKSRQRTCRRTVNCPRDRFRSAQMFPYLSARLVGERGDASRRRRIRDQVRGRQELVSIRRRPMREAERLDLPQPPSHRGRRSAAARRPRVDGHRQACAM